MRINKAKEYFHLGLMESAEVRAPFMKFEGWTIEFYGRFGSASALLETAVGEVREFASIDTAAKALAQIGFTRFTVIQDAGGRS